MIDEIFDRAYQARRVELNAGLSAGLHKLAQAAAEAFLLLNRIEYDAPWRRYARSPRTH